MRYSLKQAAEAVGKGKTTIHRDVKAGRLSASKDERGRLWIDAAELHRVYPPVAVSDVPPVIPRNEPDGLRVVLLEREVEHLRAMLEREREACRDLGRRLDDEAAERRRLTALLTHHAEAGASQERPQESGAGLFERLRKWTG